MSLVVHVLFDRAEHGEFHGITLAFSVARSPHEGVLEIQPSI
jgi:hypothetical protein